MGVHGCLACFTQQGLAKYNDTMTTDYFRCTSHKGEQALFKAMQKHNRIKYLCDRDAKRVKHQ